MKLAAGMLLLTLAVAHTVSLEAAGENANPYAPLRLYQGTWLVKKNGSSVTSNPERLTDDCALVGIYFVCQQTVDGKPKSLLIFVPRQEPGQYYTQGVTSDGQAFGRAELTISGNTWIYSHAMTDNDKTTYYKTVNVFNGTDRIHFEQSQSGDGVHWVVTGSGDELRSNSGETAKP